MIYARKKCAYFLSKVKYYKIKSRNIYAQWGKYLKKIIHV